MPNADHPRFCWQNITYRNLRHHHSIIQSTYTDASMQAKVSSHSLWTSYCREPTVSGGFDNQYRSKHAQTPFASMALIMQYWDICCLRVWFMISWQWRPLPCHGEGWCYCRWLRCLWPCGVGDGSSVLKWLSRSRIPQQLIPGREQPDYAGGRSWTRLAGLEMCGTEMGWKIKIHVLA